MVKIRLTRAGAKKRPFYRIIAIDERRQRDGRALEFLGTYDPKSNPERIQLRSEALRNLKLGIEAQYAGDDTPVEPPTGRVAKRQAAYVEQIGAASGWKHRLSSWDTEYDIPEEPLLPVVSAS